MGARQQPGLQPWLLTLLAGLALLERQLLPISLGLGVHAVAGVRGVRHAQVKAHAGARLDALHQYICVPQADHLSVGVH